MQSSAQVKASIIGVAGQWAFEGTRMLQEESTRRSATKSFEDLLKEHFGDYYDFLMDKFSNSD